jgi:peptide/nickel transport system substrate-binding protein
MLSNGMATLNFQLQSSEKLLAYVNAAPEGNYTSSGDETETARPQMEPEYIPPLEPQPSESNNNQPSESNNNQPPTTSEPSHTTPGPTSPKSGCLIATAAFGSEISPQVQFLRNFRDNRILSTTSGSSFMNVFNAWYYSFSPYVADYERGQPWLQSAIRTAIYPLLGILQLSEKSYSLMPGEYGSFVAGLTASSLIGIVYFSPVALCIKNVRNSRKFDLKVYSTIVATITIALLIALMVNNKLLLMITAPLFVVTLCAISSIFGARIAATLSKSLIICLKKPNRFIS